jgi:hypothetical protein
VRAIANIAHSIANVSRAINNILRENSNILSTDCYYSAVTLHAVDERIKGKWVVGGAVTVNSRGWAHPLLSACPIQSPLTAFISTRTAGHVGGMQLLAELHTTSEVVQVMNMYWESRRSIICN